MTEKIELRVGNPPKNKAENGPISATPENLPFLKVRFINSWFIYQRSLKLPVKSSSTSITVLASSLLIQMLCTLMSKLKNPCRLSRRLGCWDNPSDPKTHHCIQWGINGRWGKVTFLILSAKSLTWMNMNTAQNLYCIIIPTLHHSWFYIHWQLLQCLSAKWSPSHTIPAAVLDNATPLPFSQYEPVPVSAKWAAGDKETSPSAWLSLVA